MNDKVNEKRPTVSYGGQMYIPVAPQKITVFNLNSILTTDSVVATLRVTPLPGTSEIHVNWTDGRVARVKVANANLAPSAFLENKDGDFIFREVLPVKNGVVPYASQVILTSVTGSALSVQTIDFEVRPRIRISYGPLRWTALEKFDAFGGGEEFTYQVSLVSENQELQRGPFKQEVSNNFFPNWHISEAAAVSTELDISDFDIDNPLRRSKFVSYRAVFVDPDSGSWLDPFGLNDDDVASISDNTNLGLVMPTSLPDPDTWFYEEELEKSAGKSLKIKIRTFKQVKPVIPLPPVSGTVADPT